MSSSTRFFVTLFLISLVLAQTSRIAFTSVPAAVVAGQQYNITWAGGDGSAVRITLRKGNPANLDTIGTLADGISATYFLWTVGSSLPTASDYALQITQGQIDNYSGEFSLVGAAVIPSISDTGYTTMSAPNATSTQPTTVVGGESAASVGTGTVMSRNITFVSQSLTSKRITTTTTAAATAATTTNMVTASVTVGTVAATTTAHNTALATSNSATLSRSSSMTLVTGFFGAIWFLQNLSFYFR